MLKQRVITALILGILVLGAVIWAPVWLFSLLVGCVTLYGAWEWSNFCRIGRQNRLVYVGVAGLIMCVIAVIGLHHLLTTIVIAAGLFWLLAIVMVLRFPEGLRWSACGPKLVIGMWVLVPAWAALTAIKALPDGVWLIFLLLFLVWGADTGAYFAGRAMGKRKLMPRVSPGKTLEGVYGGLVTCVVIAAVYAFLRELSFVSAVFLIVLAVITAVASVLGDLFESMFKRERGIKDSGTLLPGHGGVLDRIDSITAAAPIFLLGLIYFPVL